VLLLPTSPALVLLFHTPFTANGLKLSKKNLALVLTINPLARLAALSRSRLRQLILEQQMLL
jgi:hypothetical protein